MGDVTLESINNLLQEQTRILKDEFQTIIKKISIKEARNEKRIQILETRCAALERTIRRNNIIVFGLKPNQEKIFEYTLKELNNLFNLNIGIGEVNNIRKISRKPDSPVIVEFVNYQTKLRIFRDKEALRKLKIVNIAISNDYCLEDRLKQKTLRKHLKIAREKGIPAKIRGFVIEIDGKIYKPEDLEGTDTDSENDSSQGSDLEVDVEADGEPSGSEHKRETKIVAEDRDRTTDEKKRKKESPSPTTKTKKARRLRKNRF